MKTFADAEKAKKEHDKLVNEKTKKGYVESTAAPAAPKLPAGATLREALEAAIIADPADRSAYMAYVDWLSEQSDTADFLRVQLA